MMMESENRLSINETLRDIILNEGPDERYAGSQPREYPTKENISQTTLPGAHRTMLQTVVPDYTIVTDDIGKEGTFIRIVKAIQEKSPNELSKILQEGSYKQENVVDPSSMTTIFHLAAKHGTKEVWEILTSDVYIIDYINTQDERGISPLIAACWYNNHDGVTMLLENDAESNLYITDTRKTALHCAVELPTDIITETLLEYNNSKFFIDAQDYEGNTALMLAVNADSTSINTLLKEGSDYTKKNSVTGRNILHMAIMNKNYPLITFLCTNCVVREFLDALDMNGDSPLLLAVRLDNDKAVEILFGAKNLGVVLLRSLQLLHILVAKGKIDIIKSILAMVDDKSIFNYVDGKGRTILMHAIESQQLNIVDLLLKSGISYKARNYKTGATVMHLAAYANNKKILFLLLNQKDIDEVINVKDNEGVTPIDIVLGKGGRDIWLKFVDTGYVDENYKNRDGETTLFIAAKEGNIYLVMSLLLSEKFNDYFDKTNMALEKEELLSLELKGLIYASDVYILCGYDVGKRGWQRSPDQEYLFTKNIFGHNIFHACSIGENIECLSLIFNYCLRFNRRHKDLDKPDNYGNTPFMISIERGSKSLATFYMKNGVNIAHRNYLKHTPLDKLNKNLYFWKPVIVYALEECTLLHHNVKNKDNQEGELNVNFNLFCPKGVPQMFVVLNMFSTLKGNYGQEILESPIIEYFVKSKWERVRYMVGMRFFWYSLMVVLLSTYLSILFTVFLGVNQQFYNIIVALLFLLSVITVFFQFQYFFIGRTMKFLVHIACPLLTIYFLCAQLITRTELEIGAAAVLSGWLSLLFHGYITQMGFQISVFVQVLKEVLSHLPLCLLLLMAFANCFFTLYHDFLPFNNPIHSFITTGTFLIDGENMVPQFNENIDSIIAKRNIYESFDKENELLDGEKEMRGLLVEGAILLAFDILITVSVMNMLIGLAVTSGEKLVEAGNLSRIHFYIKEISEWEQLMETKFYTFISKAKLSLLFGLSPRLKNKLQIPTSLRPMSENRTVQFNVEELYSKAIHPRSEENLPFPSFKKHYLSERLGRLVTNTKNNKTAQKWLRDFLE